LIKKDRLFYDLYEYCIGFSIDEASCLRVLDHAGMDDLIDRRQQWREISRQRWVTSRQKYGITLGKNQRDITEKTREDLHVLADVLLQTSCKFKLVVSVDQGYIYTNDLELIDQVDVLPQLQYKSYTQAVIHRRKNTIKLKKSPHSFRSYFRMIKMTAQQKDQLHDFLHGQRQLVRLSPALQIWMDQPFNRSQDYFFVDHSTESWLTMLALVAPGLIRKTVPIITGK
jgi:hypothetical protein